MTFSMTKIMQFGSLFANQNKLQLRGKKGFLFTFFYCGIHMNRKSKKFRFRYIVYSYEAFLFVRIDNISKSRISRMNRQCPCEL